MWSHPIAECHPKQITGSILQFKVSMLSAKSKVVQSLQCPSAWLPRTGGRRENIIIDESSTMGNLLVMFWLSLTCPLSVFSNKDQILLNKDKIFLNRDQILVNKDQIFLNKRARVLLIQKLKDALISIPEEEVATETSVNENETWAQMSKRRKVERQEQVIHLT